MADQIATASGTPESACASEDATTDTAVETKSVLISSPTGVSDRRLMIDEEEDTEDVDATEHDKSARASEQSECPVCLTPFARQASDDDDDENMVVVVATKCGHKFCVDCLSTAALRTPSCPMCRESLEGWMPE